ncbi:MAG: ribbon-helix-helix domain-containing protein [Alphaproteobacteria bacterium]|nr:ribbon-helix-helix domain-containing protein [Alphaproteobacteria bacterium]MBP7759648.1 ribbon-helix-helix domain-containing protein [Alphaproteobacteria bacterium]MBP7762998.1 ribbon-helix-helix domain-containing protein [Alphaproteobacteria bacterium]MBP7904443.1 ribbon-helix-helix domain-containing protein [Alphaproteobacteria bacterium]
MGLLDEQSSERAKGADESVRSTLVSRNVTVYGRRTSIRLEPEMWEALKDVAKKEKCSVHNLCTLVFLRKNGDTSLTAAIRVFLMLYFKAAATEGGHQKAGHGSFENMKKRAKIPAEYDSYFSKNSSGTRSDDQDNAKVA